jgi:hypothetical protein
MPGLRAVLPRAGPICGPSVAIDGSKFRAVASAKRIMGERKVAEEAVRIDQQIAAYLANLDSIDASEPADSDAEQTAAALKALRARRTDLDALAARLKGGRSDQSCRR